MTPVGSARGLAAGGGGGLGAGGDIFVQQGGSLTIEGGSLSGGSVTGGAGAGNAGDGSAYGSGIFLQGDQSITLAPPANQTMTIDDVIADQSGSGGIGTTAGTGALGVNGPGTVVLDATNTFTGGITVNQGTIELAAAGAAGSGADHVCRQLERRPGARRGGTAGGRHLCQHDCRVRPGRCTRPQRADLGPDEPFGQL